MSVETEPSVAVRPTMQIKWFRVEDNYIEGVKPLAQIGGYPECDPDWYCLKQLWSDGEWRDVEAIL